MTELFRNLMFAAEGTAVPANDAAAAADAGTGAVGIINLLLTMVIMFAVFYFFLIRPQRKKEKQTKAMLDALKKGDRVCTIGGIYGTIVSIKDDTVTLAVGSEKTEMVMARWAIRSVEDVSVENEGELLN